jgi:uncharacterized protein YlxW (UPF0749 family)
MLKTRSWQVGLGLVSMVLGFLFSFHLQNEWKIQALLPTRQMNELDKIYNDQRMQLEKYRKEKEHLRKQVRNYSQERELVQLKMATGAIPLKGKGIVITLSNPDESVTDFQDPGVYMIDYCQLKLLINELWVKGAEAIAINNYRIKNTSGFSCAGTIILVDTKKIAPPYTIAVIGDPNKLKNVLLTPGNIIEDAIVNYNLKFTIRTEDEVEVPAYKETIFFEYARPVKE